MFGILSDYEDLATKYNNGEISFEEFSKLCKERSNQLNPKNKENKKYYDRHNLPFK